MRAPQRLMILRRGRADRDAQLWADTVVSNGGGVSLSMLALYSAFNRSQKNSGGWQLSDDMLGLWGENAIQSLTSLKQRRLAVAVNSPAFVAGRGYTSDGTASYLNSGFDCASHAVAMTADSIRIAAYERTYIGGSGATLGVNSSLNRALNIRSSGASLAANGQVATFTTSTPVVGFLSSARRGPLATDQVAFRNSAPLTRTGNASALGVTLPSGEIFVGCLNNNGSPAIFRATQVSFILMGAALSDVQEAAQYADVQKLATELGAQV